MFRRWTNAPVNLVGGLDLLMVSFCSQVAYSLGRTSSGLEYREDRGSEAFFESYWYRLLLRHIGYLVLILRLQTRSKHQSYLVSCQDYTLHHLQSYLTSSHVYCLRHQQSNLASGQDYKLISMIATWLHAKITPFISTRATWSSCQDYALYQLQSYLSSGQAYKLFSTKLPGFMSSILASSAPRLPVFRPRLHAHQHQGYLSSDQDYWLHQHHHYLFSGQDYSLLHQQATWLQVNITFWSVAKLPCFTPRILTSSAPSLPVLIRRLLALSAPKLPNLNGQDYMLISTKATCL